MTQSELFEEWWEEGYCGIFPSPVMALAFKEVAKSAWGAALIVSHPIDTAVHACACTGPYHYCNS